MRGGWLSGLGVLSGLLLLGCGGSTLTAGGHTLTAEEVDDFNWVTGSTTTLDLELDGQPLQMHAQAMPLVPPPERMARWVWSKGELEDGYYAHRELVLVSASSPEQAQAAREFLDAGWEDLAKLVRSTGTYRNYHLPKAVVLLEYPAENQPFAHADGQSFELTPGGYLFADDRIVGKLEQDRDRVTGLTLESWPEGWPPLAEFQHAQDGLDLWAWVGAPRD